MKKYYLNKITSRKTIIRTSYAEWVNGSGSALTKTTYDEYELSDTHF